MYETLEEGSKFRGEISLGNTVVRLKRRGGGPSEKKITAREVPLVLSPLSSFRSCPSSPLSFPREHATCCRECRLATLEASRTLVAVLVFPFSHPPGDEDGTTTTTTTTPTSLSVCLEKPLLREHTGMGYVSGEQDRLL